MKNIIQFLTGMTLLVNSGLLFASSPNIVLIMADDLGWTDLACYGSEYYETPHLDQLCSGGMKFLNAYSNGPNCQPTRAALLSGQYSPRTGVFTVGTGARGQERFRKMISAENQTFLKPEVVTIAESLKKAGYQTGCFGKWHLGNKPEYHPLAQGFDEEVHSGGKNPPPGTPNRHPATEHITKATLKFIRKNQDKKFFAYVPFHAVHTPIRAPEHLIKHYEKKPKVEGHKNPVYAGMLTEMDSCVGRILNLLKELQLEENTIVIFYSDNGGLGGYARAGIIGGQDLSDNKPLRGGKGMLYEGGIRVPLFVRWKGQIKPGSLSEVPVLSIDFYPTLLELAKVKKPDNMILDGQSLVTLWKKGADSSLNSRPLYWHFPGYLEANRKKGTWRTSPVAAIQYDGYKLIEFFETGTRELYHLNNDIGESADVFQKEPAVAAKLYGMLQDWREKTHAPMPKKKL
jgi:arylsulfatase A-like enzyme